MRLDMSYILALTMLPLDDQDTSGRGINGDHGKIDEKLN